MTDVSHDLAMAEALREDPALAVDLLNDILKDGDASELLVALRQMTQAFGGVSAVALAADLNPTQLYRTLSKEGNPSIRSLSGVLRAMGLRLAVEPIATAG
jgi:probable addiction module antidote protein